MTAPVPRERKVGTIAFANSTFGVDLFGPNGGLPLLVYEYWILRLTGTLTISGGTTNGTPVVENPRTLIKAVQVVVTGLTGDTFIDIPMTDLVILTNFIGRRPGIAPQETAVTSGAIGATNFVGEYYLPFALEDMTNPYRGFFASNRYAQVRLRILWGTTTDLVSGGDRTLALTVTGVDVWVREYSFDTRFESNTDYLLHQRVNVKQVSINAAAQTNFDIEIPRTASFLRGVLIKQYTDNPETPITTLIGNEQQVTLIYNDNDRKFEFTWNQLIRKNREDYAPLNPAGGPFAFPTGYAFVDLTPGEGRGASGGDFSLLNNMLNFQRMVLRIDNSSVANAFVRMTLVKYALSA
jgi:hypothetical protein